MLRRDSEFATGADSRARKSALFHHPRADPVRQTYRRGVAGGGEALASSIPR